ncbi:MAG TPA: polyhydroxyalkanoic acid system family protein [Bryobacteraceae bacterium]|jgi:hypothetical protein|nr:polyhydroxyalkanoic acid system family protein [Bryobacteraceae bacterium]
MRVTVSHNTGRQEAMRRVDRGIDQLLNGMAGGPIEIRDQQKSWNGNVMNFALTGKMGFFTAPIKGTITVNDADIVIEADLGMLEKFIPAEKIKSQVESGARKMLTSGS